jgi:hypothetical protein
MFLEFVDTDVVVKVIVSVILTVMKNSDAAST